MHWQGEGSIVGESTRLFSKTNAQPNQVVAAEKANTERTLPTVSSYQTFASSSTDGSNISHGHGSSDDGEYFSVYSKNHPERFREVQWKTLLRWKRRRFCLVAATTLVLLKIVILLVVVTTLGRNAAPGSSNIGIESTMTGMRLLDDDVVSSMQSQLVDNSHANATATSTAVAPVENDELEWFWDHNVYYEPIVLYDDDKYDDDDFNLDRDGDDDDLNLDRDGDDDDLNLDRDGDDDEKEGRDDGTSTSSKTVPSKERNLLIAQVASARIYMDPATTWSKSSKEMTPTLLQDQNTSEWLAAAAAYAELEDIVSRPNRAYARQWGRNYVRFQRREISSNWSETTDGDELDDLILASFLKDLLQSDQQQPMKHALKHPNHRFKPYDAVLLLPPGAIVTDLDFDLLNLLPEDKLVAVAAWSTENDANHEQIKPEDAFNSSSLNDGPRVMLVNLRHSLAEAMIDAWWRASISSSTDDHEDDTLTHSFSSESLETLFHGITTAMSRSSSVWESDQEQPPHWSSVVATLEVSEGGFVLESDNPNIRQESDTSHGSHRKEASSCIKTYSATASTADLSISSMATENPILATMPDMSTKRAILQFTADAVCYRYYPKCDIL